MKIGIIGASGYGGVELYRILSRHPEVTEINVYTSGAEEIPYEKVYPHLYGKTTARLQPLNPEYIQNENDCIFLATPSGISARLTPQLHNEGIKIIDLSGDLRLKNPNQYTEWYKKVPAPETILSHAVYGLSELQAEQIKEGTILANPGCYPTATLLGLAPVVKENIVKPGSIIIDAKSGVSGAGRKPNIVTHFVEVQDNLSIYKVHEHQHIPEIEQQLHDWDSQIGAITFSTHLVPMTRGIMATIYVELKEDWGNYRLQELYEQFYAASPFVHIRTDGTFPSTKEVYGSNDCVISIKKDPRTNRLTIVSVIDNLMKGAAGQAVQNFNMMYGFKETTALDMFPLYP
jgi:N-acetyl-gamma-glutamyl-phosphate reductase